MTFSIECKVIRKKRSMMRRKPKSFFQKIPSELQSNIFDRLCRKDQSRAMCVSHSWRECILNTRLPKEETHQSLVRLLENPFLDLKLQQIFHWCSRVMCCMIDPKELIDTCNGLLLFCHNKGRTQNLTYGIDHYYVVNHATKQCVVVSKPVGQTSGRYSYATLVYDPAKSWYFKIMHFQGHRYVNVFSSENGVWTTLSLSLPEYMIASCWIKKSIYLNGSVYRLSDLGHLIKIRVDPQENVSEQAEIIPLTPEILLDNLHWDWKLSVKGGKLFFVIMSRDVNFMVYELVECTTRNVTSYSWCNVHRIQTTSLLPLTFDNLLLLHPYYEVAFFMRHKNLLYYFNISNNIANIKEVPFNDVLYRYLSFCHPALFQCFKPFICCLNKEKSRVFQRLPTSQ